MRKPAHNKGKCRWLIGEIGGKAYCEYPTKYTMQYDDDGNRVRKYNAFCHYHQSIVEVQEQNDTEENI